MGPAVRGVAAVALKGRSRDVTVIQTSAAMAPTIAIGDSVVLGKAMSRRRGDIVEIDLPNESTSQQSRTAGPPGDTVSYRAAASGRCDAVGVTGTPLPGPNLRLLTSMPLAPTPDEVTAALQEVLRRMSDQMGNGA